MHPPRRGPGGLLFRAFHLKKFPGRVAWLAFGPRATLPSESHEVFMKHLHFVARHVATTARTKLATVAALGLGASLAHAAGGHHAVDDATILDKGQCQLSAWSERERQGNRTLYHLEPGCRVGPVELSLGLEHQSENDIGRTGNLSPQLKWVLPLHDRLSVGVVAQAHWQSEPLTSLHAAGSTLLVPLTWHASDSVKLHLNLGRDFMRHAPGTTRAGAALEWTPATQWSVVAERFRESTFNHWRLGVRWMVTPDLSIDLSQARGDHGRVAAWGTLGATWAFDR